MLQTASAGETAAVKASDETERDAAVSSARRTLALEIQGLMALKEALDNGLGAPFHHAVAVIAK
jgi:hypothetical protein